jgi:hypothetical protein
MSPEAIERRLVEASSQSPLGLMPLPRIDMSPEAIEARLEEWAELTALCLELGDPGPGRPVTAANDHPDRASRHPPRPPRSGS